MRRFWDRMHEWLLTKNVKPVFEYNSIKFALFMQNKDLEVMCNNRMIIDTFYRHKCTFF